MADGDRRNCSNKIIDDDGLDVAKAEELMQTLTELNKSVSNISKIIQNLQKNIAKDAVRQIDAIAARTLH